MKKLLSVLTVLFAIGTGAFAENVINLGFSMPFETINTTGYRLDYMGAELHIASFNSDFIGFGSGIGYWIPKKKTVLSTGSVTEITSSNALDLNLTMGVALRIMDTDSFSLIITPGVGAYAQMSDSLSLIEVGPSCDVMFGYKVLGFIEVSLGAEFDYHMYMFNVDSGDFHKMNCYVINPRAGITLNL